MRRNLVKWTHLRLYMSDKWCTSKCVYMTRILVKNSRPIDAFSPRFPYGNRMFFCLSSISSRMAGPIWLFSIFSVLAREKFFSKTFSGSWIRLLQKTVKIDFAKFFQYVKYLDKICRFFLKKLGKDKSNNNDSDFSRLR